MYLLLKLMCIMFIAKSTSSLPKSRHELKDETEVQNDNNRNKQIHLEFLEKRLLKKPSISRRHHHIHQKREFADLINNKETINFENIDPLYGSNKLRSKRKSKPRKRSFEDWKLNFLEHKSNKPQSQLQVEDFFSLLQTDPSTPSVSLGSESSKVTIATSSQSLNSSELTTSFPLESIKTKIPSNRSKKIARKIILPGNINQIKLENSELYLKPVESNDIGSVFNTALEEEPNHEEIKGNSENAEKAEETTAALTNEESKRKGSEKQKCESESEKKCFCSIVSVKNYLSDVFERTSSQALALEKVKAFSCKEFSPVPDRFEINSHAKPKSFDKDKKPLTVNQETGPKEIDKRTLSDFIDQIKSSSVEDDEIEAFPGADVFLPCFPTQSIHLLSNNEDDVTYKWTHTKNKPITEGNIKPNSDGEGTLFIDEAVFVNSDNYTCTVEYINPDTGQKRQEEFLHTISIVTLPIVSVHVFLSYKTVSCDKSVTENLRKYLPHQMEQIICDLSLGKHLCAVEIHNAVCLDSTDENKERSKRHPRDSRYQPWWNREKRESSKELSLNYEVYIHKHEEQSLSATNASMCDPNCHLLTIFKLVQLLRENIDAVVTVPVYSELDNKAETFNPISSSVKIKYIFGCHDGNHHIGNGFCGACPKNTFSKNGAITCKKCPPHSYQGNIASSECIFCHKKWIPICNEYVEDYNISMIIFVLIALAVMISIIIACYMTRVKNKTMADMVSSFIPREEKSKRNVKFGKSYRSPRTARTQVKRQLTTELQAMLDTSGADSTEGETDTSPEVPVKAVSKSKKRRGRRDKRKKLFDQQLSTDKDLDDQVDDLKN